MNIFDIDNNGIIVILKVDNERITFTDYFYNL
jgi:hypothetical protein